MVLGYLLSGSLGQYVAPDPSYDENDKSRVRRSWLEFVAPDPVYYGTSDAHEDDDADAAGVSTPSSRPRPQSSRSSSPSGTERVDGAPKDDSSRSHDADERLKAHVLSASRDTADALLSPTNVWERRARVFSLCAATKLPMTDRALDRLRAALRRDPALASSRSVQGGAGAPDGFAPLHAAAAAGNLRAAELLVREFDADPNATDMQGRTALHVAAAGGRAATAEFLRKVLSETNGVDPVGPGAPLDVCGRTPLAWACRSSSNAASRDDRERVERCLFSPGDRSVCPVTPVRHRTSRRDDGLEYGWAELPGWRVEMEDAVCCRWPVTGVDEGSVSASDSEEETGVFGVFDGHGDGGAVSRFLADHLVDCLRGAHDDDKTTNESASAAITPTDQKYWTDRLTNVSLRLDALVKEKNLEGGSTAVFAILTPHQLVVANVGDSRALLVSYDDDDVHATSLSTDHKPNLETEKARVEKAGLEVVSVSGGDGDKETFHRIRLVRPDGDETSLAVSRSFGDFDFKANTGLGARDQALTCVPEVTVVDLDDVNDQTKKTNDDDNERPRRRRRRVLVLACDGVWDVLDNEEVARFVHDARSTRNDASLAEIGDRLLETCLNRGSRDNMTVLMVALPGGGNHDDEGGDRTARRIFA